MNASLCFVINRPLSVISIVQTAACGDTKQFQVNWNLDYLDLSEDWNRLPSSQTLLSTATLGISEIYKIS